jgi:YD repeat-containing protein
MVHNVATTQYFYNEKGQLIREENTNYSNNNKRIYPGYVYIYEYDDQCNMIHKYEPNHDSHTYYTYDEHGKKISLSVKYHDEEMRTVMFEYDDKGRVIREKGTGSLSYTSYITYDDDTNSVNIKYNDCDITRVYDEHHNLLSYIDNEICFTLNYLNEYDENNRLIRCTCENVVTEYKYDDNGNIGTKTIETIDNDNNTKVSSQVIRYDYENNKCILKVVDYTKY